MNCIYFRGECVRRIENIDESPNYDWLQVAPRGFPPAVWPASGKKSPAEALDAMRKGGPVRARQIRKAQTCAEATWNHTRK